MKEKIKFIIDIRPITDNNNYYHYFYCIRNKINGKEYYGIHSTKNLNDGYSGSGKLIGIAIKKYGIDSFYKQAIKFFNTRAECSEYEKFIVSLDYLKNNKNITYNVIGGGENGHFIPESIKQKISKSEMGKTVSDETRHKISLSKKGQIAWNKGLCGKDSSHYGKKRSDKTKQNIKNGLVKYYLTHDGAFKGKHHTKETRKKQSESSKGKIFSTEHKQNLSKSHIGLKHSIETRQKISENSKNYPRGCTIPKKVICVQLNIIYQSAKDAWKQLKNQYNLPSYSNFCKKISQNIQINNLDFKYLKETV